MKIPTEQTDTVVRLAWADDVSFEEIKKQTGLSEGAVIKVMRRTLKPSSFRAWRKRVSGRGAKHRKRLNHKQREGVSELNEAW